MRHLKNWQTGILEEICRSYVDHINAHLIPTQIILIFYGTLTKLMKTKVTSEKESLGRLPLLDVLLPSHEDGSLQRAVYHKETWRRQCIHHQNVVPTCQKDSLYFSKQFEEDKRIHRVKSVLRDLIEALANLVAKVIRSKTLLQEYL